MTAVVPGTVVWAVLAGVFLLWVAITFIAGPKRMPSVVDVVRWFLQSWLGRLLVLAAWAGAGWHLFCQRP
jgi:fumarate reductase subunit D